MSVAAFTVGDIFLEGNSASTLTPEDHEALLNHERRHSDWYAIMGGCNFIERYALESRTYGSCGFLEFAAEWRSGGYSFCSL